MAWISEPTAWKTNSGYGWQGRTGGEDGRSGTSAVAKYAREGEREKATPKGDGKLFDFFLPSLSPGKSEMRTEY